MKTILVLFPKDWDQMELAGPRYAGRYRFCFEGFDLFRFPGNLRLCSFNVLRFIERVVARYRRLRIDGVISNNEQFGTLIAAIVARRLGLPANDPLAVIISQHKYYARMVQQKVMPEATPNFAVFPYSISSPDQVGLEFPCFVKPVKATYSVLARRVDSFSELAQHLDFGVFERYVIRRLVKPFEDLMPAYTELGIDACHMIAEEILEGVQINVDGFVQNGKVHFLGLVDEIMYPGTQAFMRFEYPSRLPPTIQDRVKVLAEKLLQSVNYEHGFFNIEMCYDQRTDTIKVIETNPRMASQLANLYRRVDGYDPYALQLALATGDAAVPVRGQGEFATGASFVFRKFDGRPLRRTPSADQVRAALASYPDARIMLYFKKGAGLSREMKWLGSYRYAVLNLGGLNRDDLFARYHDIRGRLGFEPPALADTTDLAA